MLEPSAKLWLKKANKSIIGSGRAQLLGAIEKYGSITKAAKSMKMSYRHAWGIIKKIQESVGKEIVLTTQGGEHGGGARLTTLGKQILEQFQENKREIDNILKYGPQPALTVDGVVFDETGKLVMIRRKNPPFKGQLALPGGFVENNETTEHAVIREVQEELGVETKIKRLVGVYSEPGRDPRQHIISVIYELEPVSNNFNAGDDAATFEYVDPKDVVNNKDVAFDHSKVVADVMEFHKKKTIK
jgi:8-oxo-dGTP diphosphatase